MWSSLQIVASGFMGGGSGGQEQSPLYPFAMMAIMIVLFYFMLIRPQQRREKERRALLANIKTGDRVVFGGGIMGIIANVKEKAYVVKIADNVKVEITRGAVTQVLEKGEQPEAEQKS